MTQEEFAQEFHNLLKIKLTKLLLTKRDMMEQAINERLDNPTTLKNIAVVDMQIQLLEVDQLIFINNQNDFEPLKKEMEKNQMPKKPNIDIN